MVDRFAARLPPDLFLSGTLEKLVTAGLDLNIEVRMEVGLNMVIVSYTPKLADTDVHIQGTEEMVQDIGVHITGTQELTAGIDVLYVSRVEKQSDLDVFVLGTQELQGLLDIYTEIPDPYGYMRLRGDLVTRYWGGEASDTNFPVVYLPAQPGKTVTEGIGSFQGGFRALIYDASNEIPTSGTFDLYSIGLAGGVVGLGTGLRVISSFKIRTMADDASLFIGLLDGQVSPLDAMAAGDVLGFTIEREDSFWCYRAWAGSANMSPRRLLAIDLAERNLVLDIEVQAPAPLAVTEFRLYDRDVDMDNPLLVETLSSTNTPSLDRFGISSIGRRLPSKPYVVGGVRAQFDLADVELSTGSVFEIDPGVGILIGNAKARPYQDRPPVVLRQVGENTIWSALFDDDLATTSLEASDSITVDPREPLITITAYELDTPAIVPGSDPPVPKGSPQPGFNEVTIKWYANVEGTWALRRDSTSASNGTVLQSGSYDVPGIEAQVTFDFSDLIDEGVHDVTLYLTSLAGVPSGHPVGKYVLTLYYIDGVPVLIDTFTTGWPGVIQADLDINIA